MTPKLILGAQEIKNHFHPSPSDFIGCGMNKSIIMVSWPFSNCVFLSTLFSCRKASPSNEKDEGRGDSPSYVTAVKRKKLMFFESQKSVLLGAIEWVTFHLGTRKNL